MRISDWSSDVCSSDLPFIGAGGQLVRRALYQHRHGQPLPDFAASRLIGLDYFWANTVPYKPVGNKAWSTKIKKRYQPLMAQVLADDWRGEHLIVLGREAFFWFGLNQDKAVMRTLEAFWERDDRSEEHTSELQSLMRISYAVFCFKKKKKHT